MGRKRRVMATCALALMCAPGTWFRTDLPRIMPHDIAVEQIASPSPTDNPAWQVDGIWQYRASGRYFGGFSALIADERGLLRAFSDRGTRFTLTDPVISGDAIGVRPVSPQIVERGYERDLLDIESATRDPATGTYWLGYEGYHALHRFTAANKADGLLDLDDELDWYANNGLEAMVRLADGRFVMLGEGQDEGLIYPGDPVEGGTAQTFAFENPAPGYVATDLAQLPDGRVLMLMRQVSSTLAWSLDWPPFECLIAIGDPPSPGAAWQPQVALEFAGNIPNENYEGLAVREGAGGKVEVWVISDDNFSVQQRTLLVKLAFDPELASAGQNRD